MVTACLHHTLPCTVGFPFHMIPVPVFWGWDWLLGHSASAADMSCSCVLHQGDFASFTNSLLTNCQALPLCYCPHNWSDKRYRRSIDPPRGKLMKITDFSISKLLQMGCKVIEPFAGCQASLPGLLFLVTCHHVIPNEADSISLYPKSKHCTTEPEKVGDMEWQYYDAFSCVGHLHSRHLHFRGATLVIHNDQQWQVFPALFGS